MNTGVSYTFTTNLSQVTPFLFIDENTFVFFANNGSNTVFSCFFNTTAVCSQTSPADYKLSNPTGPSLASKRNTTSDIIALGLASGLNLTYNESVYDVHFSCLDEQNTRNRKNFTFSMLSDTASVILETPLKGYVTQSTLFGTGIKKTYITCENGTAREYLPGLSSGYAQTAYSLNLTVGAYYLFTVKNTVGVVLPDTVVSAYRYDPVVSAYKVVEQGITDSSGSVTFYLQPLTNYIMIFEKGGYVTLSTTFVPSTLATIAITINQEAGFVQPMPNYNFPFGDVSFQISPTTSYSTNATNITYIVSSQSSKLQYWGMAIMKTNSTNKTQVYFNNVTGSPSGGILNYTATENGTYVIVTWIKHEDFATYSPFPKTFSISPLTGFLLARERFETTHPIGDWAFYFFGVVCAMVVGGWASRYTYEGASWLGLIVLWGFTLFHPSAIIYQTFIAATDTFPGYGLAITAVMATSLATIGVLATTYLMKQGV